MNVRKPNLSSLWRRQDLPAETAEVDPADMGTCFGLDMTMDASPTVPADMEASAAPNWWERRSARKAFGV